MKHIVFVSRLLLFFLAGCAPQVPTPGSAAPPAPAVTVTSVQYLPGVQRNSAQTPTSEELPDLTLAPYYWQVRYDDCPWEDGGTIVLLAQNEGAADAGPFVVAIGGTSIDAAALAAGADLEVTARFERGPVGSISGQIDVDEQVAESDEQNNGFMIVFTPPPPCATVTP